MDRKSSQFKDLNEALTVKFRELRQEGVGAVVKHATIVTSSEEDTLRASNVIGDHTPLALQRAVFFSMWERHSVCAEGKNNET